MPVATPQPLGRDEFARLMGEFTLSRGARIAVAVSGGADSLALVLLLAAWGREHGVAVSALTVDHGLRAEACAEARQVARWLSPLGIDHVTLTWEDGHACKTAVQTRARQARYDLMSRWCCTNGVAHLFVAHHLGDQAETVLMRLKRSTTLFGFAAMAKRSERFGVTLCRPLLDIDKARLIATLKARDQDWIEDPSNTNPAFERVRVRALLGQLEGEGVTAQRLGAAAESARRVTDIIDLAAHAFIREACGRTPGGAMHVDAQVFAGLPQAVRERALVHVLAQVSRPISAPSYGPSYAPRSAKLERMAQWMASADPKGAPARTLAGCRVGRKRSHFIVSREGPRKSAKKDNKSLFFAAQPLPGEGKGLTSRETGAHDKA